MKKTFIGSQRILRETPLDGGMTEVTLESNQEDFPGMPNEEIVYYPQVILDSIRTKEVNNDLNALRSARCSKAISEIVLILLQNASKNDDLKHIFESVLHTVDQANLRKERQRTGVSEENQNIYQLRKELLKS